MLGLWSECKSGHTVCQHKLTIFSDTRVYTEYKFLESTHTQTCVLQGMSSPLLNAPLATSTPIGWSLPLVYPSDDRCLSWLNSILKIRSHRLWSQDWRAACPRP